VWDILGQIAFDFRPGLFPEFLATYTPFVFWTAIGYSLHFTPLSLDGKVQNAVTRMPLFAKAVIVTLFIMLVMQVKSSEVQPFIYFQF
jgi:alginate O-acetyltransferase complex protein AlgI